MRRTFIVLAAMATVAIAAPPAMASTVLEKSSPLHFTFSGPKQQCITRRLPKVHAGTWAITLYVYRSDWTAGYKRKTVRREVPVTGPVEWGTCIEGQSLPGQAHPFNSELQLYVDFTDREDVNHDGEATFRTRSRDGTYLWGASLKRVR